MEIKEVTCLEHVFPGIQCPGWVRLASSVRLVHQGKLRLRKCMKQGSFLKGDFSVSLPLLVPYTQETLRVS